MDSSNITSNVINTINTIFGNLFASIDSNLYKILDTIVFINKDILKDNRFEKIFGTSTSSGILLIANSLVVGLIIYYSTKLLISNLTFERIENPMQFFLKCIIFGICMNSSFFIIEQFLNINFNISSLIKSIGEDLFNKNISFTELINEINQKYTQTNSGIDIFTIDGLIKGTLTISLLNLVFSYSLRYIIIKILVLLSPFAFLSLCLEKTSSFFKSWLRNFFSLLFIQIIVAIVLILLFSMDVLEDSIINKFIYIGGIYSLIKANNIVQELFGGISISVQSGINNLKLTGKGN